MLQYIIVYSETSLFCSRNNNFGTADCLYGVQRTGEFRNWDSIRFQTDMFGVANPIVKKIDTWQVRGFTFALRKAIMKLTYLM